MAGVLHSLWNLPYQIKPKSAHRSGIRARGSVLCYDVLNAEVGAIGQDVIHIQCPALKNRIRQKKQYHVTLRSRKDKKHKAVRLDLLSNWRFLNSFFKNV